MMKGRTACTLFNMHYLLNSGITIDGSFLKTDDPATIIFAPASAAISIVSGAKPPSTSISKLGFKFRRKRT